MASRRQFLRAAGVTIALPWLESVARGAAAASMPPKRMLCIMADMGVLPGNFFPQTAGPGYESTPYLDIIAAHRSRMTVFSGLSHLDNSDGHRSTRTFLSGAPQPTASNFKNTISIDQLVAEQIGSQTRFPSLPLLVGTIGTGTPSILRSGVEMPMIGSPAAVYRKLFVQGSPAETEQRIAELKSGRSILDFVRDDARGLGWRAGGRDRERIEQFFGSIRDVEQSLVEGEAWERRPKPAVEMAEPADVKNEEMEQATNLMYDMARLALQTDSTRVVTVCLGQIYVRPNMDGITDQIHGLTHHGGDEAKIAQLKMIETMLFRSLDRLLGTMQGTPEPGGSLLDHTTVLYGSNLSDANKHDSRNLPIILAGGGFRHGQYQKFKEQTPLANLYTSMLQRMGFEVDAFSLGTGRLAGLEWA
jgi:hypothetical protein